MKRLTLVGLAIVAIGLFLLVLKSFGVGPFAKARPDLHSKQNVAKVLAGATRDDSFAKLSAAFDKLKAIDDRLYRTAEWRGAMAHEVIEERDYLVARATDKDRAYIFKRAKQWCQRNPAPGETKSEWAGGGR